MHIGKRLQKLRNSFELSRKEMSRDVVSYSHYCNYETGNYIPPDDILAVIADKLNISADYLLNYQKLDIHLEQLLFSLKSNIDNLALTDAERNIEEVKIKYPFINSIYQESLYYLLESCYLYKFGKKDEAFEIIASKLSSVIEEAKIEELPREFQETYYYMQAVNHYFKKNYQESYNYYLKQLPLIKSNILKASTSNNIALVLYRINNIPKAIPYAEDALNLHLREQQWEKVVETYNLLGVLYSEINNLEAAMKHYQKALEIVNTFNLNYLKDKTFNNIGIIYKVKGDLDKSLEYFNKSLEKKIKYGLNPLVTYRSIIEIYLEKDLEKAIKNIAEARKSIINEIDSYHLNVLEAKHNYKKNNLGAYELLIVVSIDYFQKNRMWNYITDISEELAEYYYNLNKYKKASFYYKLAMASTKNQKGE